MLTNLINKYKAYRYLKKTVRNKYWFDRIRYLGLDQSGITFLSHGDKLVIEDLKMEIPSKDLSFLLDGFSHLNQILSHPRAMFEINNNLFFLTLDGVKINIASKQELLIAKEVFVEKVYNTYLPANSIVIDIGMNVGFSTLFFANHNNTDHIFAFEPFKPTFEQGLKNFGLNPKLKRKITAFPYGTGKENFTKKIPYNPKTKGSASVKFDNFKGVKERTDTIFLEVKIREVSEIFKELFNEANNKTKVLKIDCEGCEYEIFEKLHSAEILKELDIIICEWHILGSKPIEKLLELNNFHHFCISNYPQIGMIYAKK